MQQTGFDRRKYPRVHTEALVSIARADQDDAQGRGLDLSLGGIRFECSGVELELDSLLEVRLRLGEREVSVVGKLVRVADLDELNQEFALAFIEVEAETLELLKDHVEY